MTSDEQKHAQARRAASFIENMIRLGVALSDRNDGVNEEDHAQAVALLDGEEPKDMNQEYLLFRACRLMYEVQAPTMSELSEGILVHNYTATRLLSWMVSKRLAERMGDPDDRRIVRVALTEKGRQFYEIQEKMAVHKVQHVLGRLTQDEQIIFSRLFEKLVRAQ